MSIETKRGCFSLEVTSAWNTDQFDSILKPLATMLNERFEKMPTPHPSTREGPSLYTDVEGGTTIAMIIEKEPRLDAGLTGALKVRHPQR